MARAQQGPGEGDAPALAGRDVRAVLPEPGLRRQGGAVRQRGLELWPGGHGVAEQDFVGNSRLGATRALRSPRRTPAPADRVELPQVGVADQDAARLHVDQAQEHRQHRSSLVLAGRYRACRVRLRAHRAEGPQVARPGCRAADIDVQNAAAQTRYPRSFGWKKSGAKSVTMADQPRSRSAHAAGQPEAPSSWRWRRGRLRPAARDARSGRA